MNSELKEKIQACPQNDGCAPDLKDGKAVVDKVRQVGVGAGLLETPHVVECECGESFKMVHFEEHCPKCNMVYGVTPCSSHNPSNIVPAGIDY
jgi:hypothetical protein